ncbi:MAG: hypothetical protein HN350_19960 [Phycisphaerales bacterium]|jgi:Spy/CpxP family protein refolding chaperone|nr:hypothetical protein [Phycisphaerales bacterium]
MKLSKWLLCVMVALTFSAGSVLAKEGGKAKKAKPAGKKARVKKPKSPFRGEYAIMASQLKMTDAQKAQLTEIVKAQSAAKKAYAEAAKPIQTELAAAKKAGDKTKAKELGAKLKALRGDPKATTAKVMAILTPEQKAEWAKFGLYRRVCSKFGRAKLTDEQKTTVRDMCTKSDIKTTGDRKADAAALKSLTDKIAAEVLTDAQREAIKPKPRVKKEKPAGAKKPRVKKPKKGGDQ